MMLHQAKLKIEANKTKSNTQKEYFKNNYWYLSLTCLTDDFTSSTFVSYFDILGENPYHIFSSYFFTINFSYHMLEDSKMIKS